MPFRVALIAVEGAAYGYDSQYSYLVPEGFRKVSAGMRVIVPFGRGNRPVQGIIMEMTEAGDAAGLKKISRVIDEKPVIGKDMIALAVWLRNHVFCTYFEALRLMLPAGINVVVTKKYVVNPELPPNAALSLSSDESAALEIVARAAKPVARSSLLKFLGLGRDAALLDGLVRRKILLETDEITGGKREASETMLRLSDSFAAAAGEDFAGAGEKLTTKQKKTVETISLYGSATVRETMYFAGVTRAVINTLLKKRVLEQFQRRVYRTPYKQGTPCEPPPRLSTAQQAAFEKLLKKYEEPRGSAALLYGVTGSGKTLIYIKLIERALRDGKSVILMVPEISLTPQTVSRFYAVFGKTVAVLHSGMPVGERLDEWDRVKAGYARIVIGTRSAVFAPVKNLGLLILDEEQEHTYKSEASPRYHARDVARYRCAKTGSLLLLASATPSVESFHAAQAGRYALVRLDERYGGAKLPTVQVVDMKKELAAGNATLLSAPLLNGLKENLKAGRQSILLLNRRGFNTFISCPECGAVLTCPHCSIALTYHAANGMLVCHTCGYSVESFTQCPSCHSGRLKYSGAGTQKIEQTIAELLPQARVLRMDTDTTLSNYSHEKILSEFSSGKYDILIGTQMVAKGLDFPNVTLVGILSADQMLYLNDFRASEKTFSLLTQVIGRSGRGHYAGRAIIQTQTPENSIIRLASHQDYDAFYQDEIRMRKMLIYPPFCDIYEIWFSGAEEEAARKASEFFAKLLVQNKPQLGDLPLRMLGPVPAGVLKVNNRYRYKIILKCRDCVKFRGFVQNVLTQYFKDKISRRAAAFVDVNPLSMG